jgi:predicted site-specific integrase-resolvase
LKKSSSRFRNHGKETNVSIKHLNQRQLADRWDVSEASLERWRTAGIGPVYLKLQGRVLYRLEDVEAYEAASLHRSTSERVPAGGAA